MCHSIIIVSLFLWICVSCLVADTNCRRWGEFLLLSSTTKCWLASIVGSFMIKQLNFLSIMLLWDLIYLSAYVAAFVTWTCLFGVPYHCRHDTTLTRVWKYVSDVVQTNQIGSSILLEKNLSFCFANEKRWKEEKLWKEKEKLVEGNEKGEEMLGKRNRLRIGTLSNKVRFDIGKVNFPFQWKEKLKYLKVG